MKDVTALNSETVQDVILRTDCVSRKSRESLKKKGEGKPQLQTVFLCRSSSCQALNQSVGTSLLSECQRYE